MVTAAAPAPASRWKPLAAAAADRLPVLVDLYRLTVHPGWEAALWRDYLVTRRRLGWLRTLPAPAADARRALFVLRRENVFDVKSRLMLGAALKLQGVEPVVLANHRRTPRIRRYAAAFGVAAVRFRDELPLTGEESAEAAGLSERLMERPDDFAAVLGWRYRGHPLGERVLSTLIRETLAGEPDLADPAIRRRLRRILRQVVENYLQAERVLDAVRPTWVMADEIGYGTNGPLVDVALARGLDVFETSPFLRDGALVFKRLRRELGRAPAATVAPATLAALEESPWTPQQDAELEAEIEHRYAGRSALQRMYQGNTAGAGRDEIHRQLELDPRRPIAVVFSHVLWDASFFYDRDLFANYRAWLEATLHAAVANPEVSWLIKTHPANAFRLRHGDVSGPVAEVEVVRHSVDVLPDHVRLLLPETRVSSLSLFRHAEVGITVRGTAGLEMACFAKPVLTAGTGHYSGLGFTHDSDTAEEYLDRLRRIGEHLAPLSEEQRVRARRYAHALFLLRPWTARSFEIRHDFPEQGWHPLDRNLVPRARSLAEARALGDLDAWSRWAVHGNGADYLEAAAG